MSLADLNQLVKAVGYAPRTLRVDVQGTHLAAVLSPNARAFVHEATEKYDKGAITLGQLFDKRWHEDAFLMEFFFDYLTDEEKIEVLCFFTVLVHELVHHVDFMSTPFGVNFHYKSFQEYHGFQAVAPVLLEHPDLVPNGRLVEFDTESPVLSAKLEHLAPMWRPLRNKILIFEAWGDGRDQFPHRKRIDGGWGSGSSVVRLLGHDLVSLTVNKFMPTVAWPHEKEWYLRPLTIFETRAVTHSLLWIKRLLGEHESLNRMLLGYIDAFYSQDTQVPDYFFVQDVLARGLRYKDFRDFLERSNPVAIEQILLMMSGACWYALHAPPPRNEDTLIASSPVVRLIHALLRLEDWSCLEDPRPYTCAADALAKMDDGKEAKQLGFTPVTHIMSQCDDLLTELREANHIQTRHPAMRDYFEYVFALQQRQVQKRLGNGYASKIGLPQSGNPIVGMDASDSDLLDHYAAADDVKKWFDFRFRFLWRPMQQQEVLKGLDTHFGSYEFLIMCPCGIALGGQIPRFQQLGRAECPSCGRSHDVDVQQATRLDLS